MKTFPLPCVIVAGGKSSRMGRDKSLLPFGGYDTLAEYQVSRLTPFFESLHVSVKNKDKIPFKISIIEDVKNFDAYSPLVGLYSIIKHFNTPVFILSVDTPFVGEKEIQKLLAKQKNHDIILARSPYGSHQMCGIYTPNALPIIKEHIQQDNHKIRNVLEKLDTLYVDFEDDAPFMNLNHPSQYEEALRLFDE